MGQLARLTGLEPLLVDRSTPMPIGIRYATPETVGLDRILNACGAYALGEGAAVVVDVGTATTVDVLSSDGFFIGGAILPGPELAARALANGTAALPTVELTQPVKAIEDSTASCIAAGVLRGHAGAIERLARDAEQTLGRASRLFLTGGQASLVRPYLELEVTWDPHLTLKGLSYIFQTRPVS